MRPSCPVHAPDLFPGALWLGMQIVALLAGTALAFVALALATGETATQFLSGSAQSLIDWFALLSAGGLLAYGLFVKAPLFDRYLSQLAFPVAVLLAGSCLGSRGNARPMHAFGRTTRAGTAARVATVGLALVIGAVTAALTLNADAYDGARWQAGQVAVQAGFAPSVVDAGFEWVGTHTSEDANGPCRCYPAPLMKPGTTSCSPVSGTALSCPGRRRRSPALHCSARPPTTSSAWPSPNTCGSIPCIAPVALLPDALLAPPSQDPE